VTELPQEIRNDRLKAAFAAEEPFHGS